METSRFIIVNITWNLHGWDRPYINEKAGFKNVRDVPGHESLNFAFNKKGLDDDKHVFGYAPWNGYPQRFEEPGIIFFFTKNPVKKRNEIVGIYGNAEMVKPRREMKLAEYGDYEIYAPIKAEKEKSVLFPKYLDADKYKDPKWKRLVGQSGIRYISQELAVKIIIDEIKEVERSDSAKKKLDKLYLIFELIGEEKDKKTKIFFDEDEILPQNTSPKTRQSITTIKIRNSGAVKKLKTLYCNQCQVSGKKYAFKKTDGEYYSEAHHLIPLGKGGADSVYNIVILSPLIHRMMHYAKVDGLVLKNIKNSKLSIRINGIKHTITWHPDHAKIVKNSLQP